MGGISSFTKNTKMIDQEIRGRRFLRGLGNLSLVILGKKRRD